MHPRRDSGTGDTAPAARVQPPPAHHHALPGCVEDGYITAVLAALQGLPPPRTASGSAALLLPSPFDPSSVPPAAATSGSGRSGAWELHPLAPPLALTWHVLHAAPGMAAEDALRAAVAALPSSGEPGVPTAFRPTVLGDAAGLSDAAAACGVRAPPATVAGAALPVLGPERPQLTAALVLANQLAWVDWACEWVRGWEGAAGREAAVEHLLTVDADAPPLPRLVSYGPTAVRLAGALQDAVATVRLHCASVHAAHADALAAAAAEAAALTDVGGGGAAAAPVSRFTAEGFLSSDGAHGGVQPPTPRHPLP
jgi:hypothetical protein